MCARRAGEGECTILDTFTEFVLESPFGINCYGFRLDLAKPLGFPNPDGRMILGKRRCTVRIRANRSSAHLLLRQR